MLMTSTVSQLIKILISSSVLFVWVVRYQNIVEEFKQFRYPGWLRDLVGILKITFVILILSSDLVLVQIGAIGIAVLMIAALVTHFRVGNPFAKMLPSLSLLTLSLITFSLSN